MSVTTLQRKQLDYLARREPYESLTNQPVYWCTCRTCDLSKEFHSADGARSFILNHKGHNTWLQTGKNERSS